MAAAGDLLLIFGDALTRCWKQITKFNPEGTSPDLGMAKKHITENSAAVASMLSQHNDDAFLQYEGVIRDERGIVIAPEQDV